MWEVVEVAAATAPERIRVEALVASEEALARDASGQLDRAAVAEFAKGWPASLARDAPIDHPTALRLLERLGAVLEAPGPYRAEQHFEIDLGLDSLDLVQIRLLLAEEFGVEISDRELWRFQTVGDAIRQVVAADAASPEAEADCAWSKLLRDPAEVSLDERFNMDRRGVRRWCASLGMLAITLFAKLWFRVELRHAERLPEGPFLFCPTHQSLLDSVLIYGVFPQALVRRLAFVAYGPYFHEPPLSILVRMGRIILTGEAGSVGDSMRLAYDALQRDWPLVIFPEGNCSYDGSILPAFPGVGLLACEAQVPVVPVLYEGSWRTCSPRHPGLHRTKITITIGEPFSPPPREGVGRAQWQGVADQWREAILAMRAESSEASS